MTGDRTPAHREEPLETYGPLDEIDAKRAAMVMVKIQHIRRAAIREFIEFGVDAATKKKDAAVAKARGVLSARGTEATRKAQAVVDSADAQFEADVAEVLREASEKSLFLLKDDWDTCRSITANERAERSATEGFGS